MKVELTINFPIVSVPSTAVSRPLVSRNHTKVERNDQLLSLLANRRRQIIQSRFKNHIKTIVELAKHGHPDSLPGTQTQSNDTNSNVTTLNIHINLTELLHNSVNATSDEQAAGSPSTEINLVNVSSPRSVHKNRKHVAHFRDAPQVPENKNASKQTMPIIRNILFRRKMSYLNRKLPLDFDTVAYDTLGISEIGKTGDELVMDSEDSLQVEESSHDKLIYYDVKNNSSKNSMNNFDDVSEETKTMAMLNKTHHHLKNHDMVTVAPDNTTVNVDPINITNTTSFVNNSTADEQNESSRNGTKGRPVKIGRNNTHFMSQSLYNYFRPHEDVPEEEMQPFLHFGDKLPVTKQPSADVTKNQSSTKTDSTTQKMEEKEVDENMDVSVTKPIYENKIPKGSVAPSVQKPTVVQRYMKNRSQNLTRAYEARESLKNEKKNVVSIPNLRNISRHRGYRNRTIFFHQKRNGVIHTINLHPNSTIADLKPHIIEGNIEGNQSDVEVATNSSELVDENAGKEILKTEKIVKSTASTTVITPTTRILSTDVVTSISVKSSVSTKNNTDVSGAGPNATSIENGNATAKLNKSTKPTRTENVKIPTPIFYLNKTDFIIHVPDPELTTIRPDIEIETETEPVRKFDDIEIKTRIFGGNEDVTEKEIAYTTIVTSPASTRSKTHETKAIKTEPYTTDRPNVTSEKREPEISSKTQTIDPFNVSRINAASELPLATLFNVIDFKKTDPPKNSTIPAPVSIPVPSRPTPGTETVISRKRDDDTSFDNIHAAYILASLGLLPMAVIVIYVIRNLMKRKNKCFENFEAELQDDKATIITPVARLPALVVDSSSRWEFPRAKLRLQTLLGQGNFGQVRNISVLFDR